MNRITSTLFVILSAMSAAEASHAKARNDVFHYVRQDGLETINIASQSFNFTNTNSTKSDLGGIIRDCGSKNFKCLNLSGYLISIPRYARTSGAWAVGGGNFAVVGNLERRRSPVRLVQVTAKGDTYMFFSYSSLRGVESISLQREGAGSDLAKTYFLSGERGLLAP